MRLSISAFVKLLKSSRVNHGWTYKFSRQIGSLEPGNPHAVYYRHVITGNPPAGQYKPLPGYAESVWLDCCVLLCHFPELAEENAYIHQLLRPWSILGIDPQESCRLTAAMAEFHNHEPELRRQLLQAAGLAEVPVSERPLPLIHPDYKESVLSVLKSSSKPSVSVRPKVTISVRPKKPTSKSS